MFLSPPRIHAGFAVGFLAFAGVRFATAQDAVSTDTTRRVVVSGEEVPSAYGAPPAFSRTRFSPTTTAYVLPPGGVLAATIYEGTFDAHIQPDHTFTQEIEVGLPHRFGVAFEAEPEVFRGRNQVRSISIEARYALADWNKIPLNPTFFAEYRVGTGHVLRDERSPSDDMDSDAMPSSLTLQHKLTTKVRHAQEDEDEGEDEPYQPDAIEGRLLLAQDFGERFEWALNAFFEQETGGDRGREWGFAQSLAVPLVLNERVKAGVEMQYSNFTDKDTRGDPDHRFVIGPTIAWKPNRWSRFDVSPLFGVTRQAPDAQIFVVFSMLFGGGSSGEAEAPASTRNR